MAIYERAYRPFEGKKRGSLYKVWVIGWECLLGVFPSSLKGKLFWLFLLLFSALFFFFFALVFFAFAYFQTPGWEETARDILSFLGKEVLDHYFRNPQPMREFLWNYVFCLYLMDVQVFFFLLGCMAFIPRLISSDLRRQGIVIYFSRPLGIGEYLIGKALALAIFLFLFTFLPLSLLYGVSLAFSPRPLEVFSHTWRAYGNGLLICVLLAGVTVPLALFCSSLSGRGRLTVFLWLVFWIALGIVPGFLGKKEEKVASFTVLFSKGEKKLENKDVWRQILPPKWQVKEVIPLSPFRFLLEEQGKGIFFVRFYPAKFLITLEERPVRVDFSPKDREAFDRGEVTESLKSALALHFFGWEEKQIQLVVLEPGRLWKIVSKEREVGRISFSPGKVVLFSYSTLPYLISPFHNLKAVAQKTFGLTEKLKMPFMGYTLREQIFENYLFTHPWVWSLGILLCLAGLALLGTVIQVRKYW